MEKEKTAIFIAHKDCYGLSDEAVRTEIVKHLEKDVTVCYSNSKWRYGRFRLEMRKRGN